MCLTSRVLKNLLFPIKNGSRREYVTLYYTERVSGEWSRQRRQEAASSPEAPQGYSLHSRIVILRNNTPRRGETHGLARGCCEDDHQSPTNLESATIFHCYTDKRGPLESIRLNTLFRGTTVEYELEYTAQ